MKKELNILTSSFTLFWFRMTYDKYKLEVVATLRKHNYSESFQK